MEIALQQIINAVSLGGIYALLALGLAVVFSIVRLINFAHGEIMTVGGYGIFAGLLFGMPIAAAVLMGIALSIIVNIAIHALSRTEREGRW